MRKIPRVRERTATPAELEEDRRRCLAANAKPATLPPPREGNLCACLVTFAAWRKCNGCGEPCLYVDSDARTDTDFVCRLCELRRSALRRIASHRPCKVCGRMRSDMGPGGTCTRCKQGGAVPVAAAVKPRSFGLSWDVGGALLKVLRRTEGPAAGMVQP